MRIQLVSFVAVVAIGLTSAAPHTLAQEDEALTRAKQSFAEGRSLYLQQKYLEAAASFLKAYEAKPIPAFLFNAAVAFERGQGYPDAVKNFKLYLEKAPKAADAEEIKKRIAALEKALADAQPPRDAPPDRQPPDRQPPDRQPPDRQPPDQPPRVRAVVVPVLPKLEPKGVVVVSTKPEGANLYLNNKMNLLGPSPWQGTLATGEHTLLIESKGYRPEKKTVSVSPDRIVDLYVALSQEHYLGWVQITASSPGALIYIDDKGVGAVARTPYSGFLKPGMHKIWVEKPGFEEQRQEVEVVSSSTHRVHFDLKGLQHGWLSIDGPTAQGAEVLLDGKALCTAPCEKVVVQPGTHKILVRRKGHKPVQTELIVHKLRDYQMKVDLAPKPSLVSAYVAYGVAAAFLAGGITLGFLSKNIEKDLRKEIDDGQSLVGSNDGRILRGKAYAWVANGFFGLAGVSAIFGIYYTFADRGPASAFRVSGRNVAVLPEFGPGYAGLSGSFRF